MLSMFKVKKRALCQGIIYFLRRSHFRYLTKLQNSTSSVALEIFHNGGARTNMLLKAALNSYEFVRCG